MEFASLSRLRHRRFVRIGKPVQVSRRPPPPPPLSFSLPHSLYNRPAGRALTELCKDRSPSPSSKMRRLQRILNEGSRAFQRLEIHFHPCTELRHLLDRRVPASVYVRVKGFRVQGLELKV
jgi:hypothetical protein